MKTYIALVRHGVTDWNYEGRAQGQADIPLNAEGERQAEAVAERLATERWDAVYSSDLARARATAEAICRRTGCALITDARLRERHMGPAEGMTAAEREALWPGLRLSEIPGVESDEALARRAVEVLTDIARRHPGQRIIVVSHGAILNRFLQAAAQAEPVNYRNTGISPVVWDGQRFHPAGEHDYRHLLVDGVEYDGALSRLIHHARSEGLPGLPLPPEKAALLLRYSSAVDAAWVDDRLVGYIRAFTDRVRFGYIDLLYTAPGYGRAAEVMRRRIAERYPAVRFELITGAFARAGEATGA